MRVAQLFVRRLFVRELFARQLFVRRLFVRSSSCGLVLSACLGLCASVAAQGQGHAASPPSPPPAAAPQTAQLAFVYAYLDEHGALFHVQTLAEVPASLQAQARKVMVLTDLSDSAAVSGAPVQLELAPLGLDAQGRVAGEFYRYRTRDGRVGYTNMIEQVPLAQRASAKVQLSQLPARGQLAQAIDRQLETEHDRLLASDCCKQARRATQQPLAARVWQDQLPLLSLASVLLLFILITPWMVSKIGGEPWARTFAMAAGSLMLAGLLVFGMLRARRMLQDFAALASACTPRAWTAVASGASRGPGAPGAWAAGLAKSAEAAASAATATEAQAAAKSDAAAAQARAATLVDPEAALGLTGARPVADAPGAAPAQALQQHLELVRELQAQLQRFQHSGLVGPLPELAPPVAPPTASAKP